MDHKTAQSTSLAVLKSIPELLEAGLSAIVVTAIGATQSVGAKLLITDEGRTVGTLGSEKLDALVIEHAVKFRSSREDVRVFNGKDLAATAEPADVLLLFERIQPELNLVICGAGHVGAALAVFAAISGYRVTLIDDRPEFLKRDRFPQAEINLLLTDDWSQAVRKAVGSGKGVSIAVVTRGHNEDEQCMRAAITTDADYIGLIGSKRRTSIVINRLRESRAAEERLKRIHAPIGLDIGAVTPEEVALAILAEIVCERRGGTGAPLSTVGQRLAQQR